MNQRAARQIALETAATLLQSALDSNLFEDDPQIKTGADIYRCEQAMERIAASLQEQAERLRKSEPTP